MSQIPRLETDNRPSRSLAPLGEVFKEAASMIEEKLHVRSTYLAGSTKIPSLVLARGQFLPLLPFGFCPCRSAAVEVFGLLVYLSRDAQHARLNLFPIYIGICRFH